MAPKKKTGKKYTEEQLLAAVAEVKNKTLSQRRAAEKYDVPQSTIGGRITGRYAPTILKAGMWTIINYVATVIFILLPFMPLYNSKISLSIRDCDFLILL